MNIEDVLKDIEKLKKQDYTKFKEVLKYLDSSKKEE